MGNELNLYHGSIKVVEKPLFGYGKETNDFGQGFYMTTNKELGSEWSAFSLNLPSILNVYTLNLNELKILDLTSDEYNIFNWLAILLRNRYYNYSYKIEKEAKQWIIKHYYIDISSYDLIIGYRADDSYFDIISDFLRGITTIKQLELALKAGKLGKQYVLKSKKAFDNLVFEKYEIIDTKEFYYKRKERDNKAKYYYENVVLMLNEKKNPITMRNLMSEKDVWKKN